MSTNAIFKGDNTAAFGNNFITITINNIAQHPISKIEVVTNSGCRIKNKIFTDENNFLQETIILKVNYDSEETCLLNATNVLKVAAFDELNRQYTCPESLVFYAKNGVICGYGK